MKSNHKNIDVLSIQTQLQYSSKKSRILRKLFSDVILVYYGSVHILFH